MELTVRDAAWGYMPSDGREFRALGVVPVDAVFHAIRRVNYTVRVLAVGAAAPTGSPGDRRQTDGTITPIAPWSSREHPHRSVRSLQSCSKRSAAPDSRVSALVRCRRRIFLIFQRSSYLYYSRVRTGSGARDQSESIPAMNALTDGTAECTARPNTPTAA